MGYNGSGREREDGERRGIEDGGWGGEITLLLPGYQKRKKRIRQLAFHLIIDREKEKEKKRGNFFQKEGGQENGSMA